MRAQSNNASEVKDARLMVIEPHSTLELTLRGDRRMCGHQAKRINTVREERRRPAAGVPAVAVRLAWNEVSNCTQQSWDVAQSLPAQVMYAALTC